MDSALDASDITVVIRSAGERTSDLCRRIVMSQVSEKQVSVISERPFSRALERSIEIAAGARRPWAVLLDADVLLRSDGINLILDAMRSCRERFYMMNFALLDRGFSGPSFGVHAYNAAVLPMAMRYMDLARTDQRPETRLYREMGRRGFPTLVDQRMVGLHDYEQYFRDLYRKMFVRAIKYSSRVSYMKEVFLADRINTEESRVMMRGLMDGVLHQGAGNSYGSLDVRFYEERSAAALGMLGIPERAPLDAEAAIDVDRVISLFVPSQAYLDNAHWIAPVRRYAKIPAGGSQSVLSARIRKAVTSLIKGFRS